MLVALAIGHDGDACADAQRREEQDQDAVLESLNKMRT